LDETIGRGIASGESDPTKFGEIASRAPEKETLQSLISNITHRFGRFGFTISTKLGVKKKKKKNFISHK